MENGQRENGHPGVPKGRTEDGDLGWEEGVNEI